MGIFAKHPLNAAERRVDGKTLARAPFRARQRGVRTALTITTSLDILGVGAGVIACVVWCSLVQCRDDIPMVA